MTTEVLVAYDHRPVCSPIVFALSRLLERGFVLLNQGDYQVDYPRPNDESLYFRLQSPAQLETLDLTEATYNLAQWAPDNYMCECHYHMVKLVDVV